MKYFLFVFFFGGAAITLTTAMSQSMSCTWDGNVKRCEKSTDASGNVAAGAAMVNAGGSRGPSTHQRAETGDTNSGNYDIQESRSGGYPNSPGGSGPSRFSDGFGDMFPSGSSSSSYSSSGPGSGYAFGYSSGGSSSSSSYSGDFSGRVPGFVVGPGANFGGFPGAFVGSFAGGFPGFGAFAAAGRKK